MEFDLEAKYILPYCTVCDRTYVLRQYPSTCDEQPVACPDCGGSFRAPPHAGPVEVISQLRGDCGEQIAPAIARLTGKAARPA